MSGAETNDPYDYVDMGSQRPNSNYAAGESSDDDARFADSSLPEQRRRAAKELGKLHPAREVVDPLIGDDQYGDYDLFDLLADHLGRDRRSFQNACGERGQECQQPSDDCTYQWYLKTLLLYLSFRWSACGCCWVGCMCRRRFSLRDNVLGKMQRRY